MTEYEKYFNALRGKSVGVVGLGVSNLPLIGLLLKHGADITVYDRKSPGELGDDALELEKKGVAFVSGESCFDEIKEELVFRTPGVLPTVPGLARAAKNGSLVTSEMELFFELCPAKIIAITGSDGKTTTSTVIAELLKSAGHTVFLGGNIGKPLLSDIVSMNEKSIAVVELSSFQLMDMRRSPDTAVITNVTPNHLDKHTDMAEYIRAKENIFAFQSPECRTVANLDNEITKGFLAKTKAKAVPFSRKTRLENGVYLENGEIILARDGRHECVLNISDIKLPGMHNVENYIAAVGAVFDLVTKADIFTVASQFGGVQNRMEFVREVGGVRYYNSSIDSSPTRTIAALSVFDRKIILIAGGSDKHISFDSLGEALVNRAKRVLLTGHTAGKIEAAVKSAPGYREGEPELIFESGVASAVKTAHSTAREGDIVVLSPACASYDAFKNFEERGEVFRRAVRELQ